MKRTYVSSSSSGMSFTGLLTIAFIVLKLLNVISWSWFWVLSPMIFLIGIGIILLLILLVIHLI